MAKSGRDSKGRRKKSPKSVVIGGRREPVAPNSPLAEAQVRRNEGKSPKTKKKK
jgi:hypothetical protein